MRIEAVRMTPENAHEILERSEGQRQRRLNVDRVAVLAREMVNGNFRVTHQAVALDPDGVCIDGQHRLAAVVKADIPVEMTVAFDADPATFDVIDVGRARTTAQTLMIEGHANATQLAAAARFYLLYEKYKGQSQVWHGTIRGENTTHDVLAFVGTPDGERVLDKLTAGYRVGQANGRSGARAWLGVAMAIIDAAGADPVLQDEFWDKMERGALLNEGSPILAFRRWFGGGTGYAKLRHSDRAQFGIAVALKTWNLWIRGESKKLTTFKLGIEPMPLVEVHRLNDALSIEELMEDDAAAS